MFNDHLSHSIKSSMRNKLNDDWMCLWETRERKTNFRSLSRKRFRWIEFLLADNWFHASKGSLSFLEIFVNGVRKQNWTDKFMFSGLIFDKRSFGHRTRVTFHLTRLVKVEFSRMNQYWRFWGEPVWRQTSITFCCFQMELLLLQSEEPSPLLT